MSPITPRSKFFLLNLALTLILAACTSGSTTSSSQTSYPGPTRNPDNAISSPLPLTTSSASSSISATPLPNEQVVVGSIVAISDPTPALPYAYWDDDVERGNHHIGRLFVRYQGQDIRLGDDYGNSSVEWASEKYLVWRYYGSNPNPNPAFKPGLQIYEAATGNSTLFASGWDVGAAKLVGEWVVYVAWERKDASQVRRDAPYEVRPLFAYHITSGETFTISTSLPVMWGRDSWGFYAPSSQRLGLMEYDMETQRYTLKVIDLDTGEARILKVTDLRDPKNFSLSEDIVVWRDIYWHGYSLTYDAPFTLPYVPPGWEHLGWAEVYAGNSAIMWKIRINDDEFYYFSAPVGLQSDLTKNAWNEVALPPPPTAKPKPIYTPEPLPTSYP